MSAPRLLAPTTISGGVPTAGAGTLNTIALWTPDGNTLGNSLLTQAGTTISNSSGAIRATGTTAGAPAFTGADTDTGMYFPAANQMRFSTAGSPAISIDATQQVGIGTASPVSRTDIAGASVDQLAWGVLSVRSSDAQGADKGGSLAFGGLYDATNSTHWAQISGRKENGTSGQYGGYLAFATRTNGAGANTERARIDSSGVLTTTDLATYSLSGTTASVASGGTSAALFTPAASSEYIVYIQATSNTGVMAHAMVLQNGAASGALVSVVGSVLCTINNAAGALTITNNSGSAETFRWRALKLRSLV
jgi:hypothetical protein